jgi:hypothetical protein
MADGFRLVTESDVSLTGASAKTVAQVTAPAGRRLGLRRVTASFKSTTTTDGPALVEVLRQTTAGTATSQTVRPLDSAQAFDGSGAVNFSAEPTASDILWSDYVPVQGGSVDIPFDPALVKIAASGRIGVRITAPQAQSCRASIEVE